MNNPGNKRTVYSVSELNSTIRRLLESEFPLLWVEGEISNLARPASGHIYFTLKDNKSQVRCAMFKGRNQLLRFTPENGQQVLLRAKPGLYEARGDYQLIGEHMEAAGDGLLQRAFEALKQRLLKEGLFNENRKQPLPQSISRIALITSATGAAVKDVISVLGRRFPAMEIRLFGVAVQGDQAMPQIIHALQRVNELSIEGSAENKSCDVVLLVRGGGSLEDLWAFNEEALARAIYASQLPVITGIGHEVDFSIADFVADIRGATPSAAAELVSPSQQTYLHRFQTYQENLTRQMHNRLARLTEKSHWLRNRLLIQHPDNQLTQQRQRLDELSEKLISAMQNLLPDKKHSLAFALQQLVSHQPEPFIDEQKQLLEDLNARLVYSTQRCITDKRQQLASISRTLQAVSPLDTLSRGYSITRDEKGNAIRRAQALKTGDTIRTQFNEGKITSRVEKIIIS